MKTEQEDPSLAAQERRLLIPAPNLDLISGMRSTGTSMDNFVRGVGVRLTHIENLLIKKLRISRETGDLEAETGENPKKPDIGRVVESYFNLPNEYSSSIILTDSDFILTNRTCPIAITADMSFRTALAADFRREYKNIEFLWKQRPGIGGVAALPPVASQIPGKYLCFPNMRVMRWRKGAFSGSVLANEPGLGSSRTYQPGEMHLPTKPKTGLRRMHQEMNSEAASSSSQLRAAVSPKRARVEEEV